MSFDTIAGIRPFDWRTLLFTFEGRTRRSHFWIGWLTWLVISLIANWISLIGGLLALLLIWPNLAITVKRLHDMGHGGWLAAVPWAVGVIGASAVINTAALERQNPIDLLSLLLPAGGLFGLVVLTGLGFLLWIGLTDGHRGPNRFGPDPKESATFAG